MFLYEVNRKALSPAPMTSWRLGTGCGPGDVWAVSFCVAQLIVQMKANSPARSENCSTTPFPWTLTKIRP